MRRRRASGPFGFLAALGLAAIVSSACTNESAALRVAPPTNPTISFSHDLQPIFNQSCMVNSGCHVGSLAPFGFVLEEGKSYGNLVGVPSAEVPTLKRVEPGRSDLSYIINKLEGVGNLGDRMPATGMYLSDAEIQLFKDWIDQGASDN